MEFLCEWLIESVKPHESKESTTGQRTQPGCGVIGSEGVVDSRGKGTGLPSTHIIQSLLRPSQEAPGNMAPIGQEQPLEGGELRAANSAAAEGRGHQPGDLG